MKNNRKTLLTLLMCICLLANLVMPAYAANTLGVTFSATLDNSVIQTSNQDQTVVMRVEANTPVLLESISVDVVCAFLLSLIFKPRH